MTVTSSPARTGAEVRRTELAAFLRACRSRIGPEAVGLPPGPRRRTPGLRREEVAQLAGVGVTWYTWLEQGRPINASEQVVEAIARTLRLDPAERSHLFRLAEVPPPRDRPTAVTVPDEVQGILDALDPLPAVLQSSRYDVVGTNAGYRALFPRLVAGDAPNVIRCAFTLPRCCTPFVDLDAELPRLVSVLRANYGRHVGEPGWEEFLGGLRTASPLFAELWDRQQVTGPARWEKVFRHAAAGDLRFTTTSLTVAAAPELRVVVYTPRDDHTRAALAHLRDHPDAAPTDHDH